MDSRDIARRRIIALIEANEPSYICFEAKFHLKANTVSEWKRGRTTTFMNILPEIAKEYKVSTDWLLGVEAEEVTPTFISVPIIGSIRAGYPVECYDVEGGHVKIPAEMKPAGKLFALDVVGDSMMPLVMDGDRIICSKNINKANGKICVITVEGESTLKKIRADNAGITLIPLNPFYKDIHYTPEEAKEKGLSIDGVLVQMIRTF